MGRGCDLTISLRIARTFIKGDVLNLLCAGAGRHDERGKRNYNIGTTLRKYDLQPRVEAARRIVVLLSNSGGRRSGLNECDTQVWGARVTLIAIVEVPLQH